jgi:hypothetical protein
VWHFCYWLEYAKLELEETKGGGGKVESWGGTEDMKVFFVKSGLRDLAAGHQEWTKFGSVR